MEEALYDPAGGFYARREPTADFYTAPELHPAFAGVLAREAVKRFERLKAEGVAGPYAIVEMGSARGLLAEQIMGELKERHPAWTSQVRYVVVERSREQLLESVLRLSAKHPNVLGYTRLDEVLPFAGVLLSNELVDAFPVHLVEKRDGRLFEVYVEESGRTALCELSRPELAAAAAKVELQDGERHAINLEAPRWLELAASKLKHGWILTVDYGKRFGAAPNPPRTFFRHTTGGDVTARKGLQDITASVDFDSLIDAGSRCGLSLESYGSLSRFLLDGGIAEWAFGASFKSRAKLKTLIHPEGMGEVFKVLIQRRTERLS